MTLDPFRPLRLKMQAPRDHGRDARSSRGVPRFIGRVVSEGAAPAAVGRVFLVAPVRIEGDEYEGAPGSVVVGPGRPVPVVVVGGRAPVIGELVVAHAAGGRWTAEVSGPAPTVVPCSPCAIPRRDLTVSWINGQSGGGSLVLTFDGVGRWSNGCLGLLSFRLACEGGAVAFSATLFDPGGCPDGPARGCSSVATGDGALAPAQHLCSPFLLSYDVTASTCPLLAGLGYQRFTVTL